MQPDAQLARRGWTREQCQEQKPTEFWPGPLIASGDFRQSMSSIVRCCTGFVQDNLDRSLPNRENSPGRRYDLHPLIDGIRHVEITPSIERYPCRIHELAGSVSKATKDGE